jgi:predicted ATPase
LLAGQKAQATAAHDIAYHYLKTGVGLLEHIPAHWREQYSLAFNVHVACAEAAYLTGDLDEKNRLVEQLACPCQARARPIPRSRDRYARLSCAR